jgi:arsenate reductase
MSATPTLLSTLHQTLARLVGSFDAIPGQRKELLGQFANMIRERLDAKQALHLNFICTHNSRRSHISQIWAQAAAYNYDVQGVVCFSGGTEATAFNPRAVRAMQKAGFDVREVKAGSNPLYEVRFAESVQPVIAFSKRYDDAFNPAPFVAVMTCSHADENCPVVLGASARIALTYDDPKEFDGTPQEVAKYDERVAEIGRELLYVFSRVHRD